MKYFFLVIFLLVSANLLAQEGPVPPPEQVDSSLVNKRDKAISSSKKEKKSTNKITIADYKIISYARDTVALDTTLTINKEYRYNYLRKDDFELLPFTNIGQPYNRLGGNFERATLYPLLGARAKHFNYMEVEDITYYNVPTPLSDLFFKTTFEQGQMLDATLTFNTSRRLNFSIAFKGFRSLGKYQRQQAESGNFRFTTNYESLNKRYAMRAHIAAQDIDNEENGGISQKEVQFESGDEEFSDRSRIDVVLTDADNKVLGKRYFLEHQYKLLRTLKDSTTAEVTSLSIGHQFNYETKFYQFKQAADNAFFGEAFLDEINDQARLKTAYNQISATFSNRTLGDLTAYASLYNYNYFFNSILVTSEGQIQNRLKGEEIAAGASYEKQLGGFQLRGNMQYNISGDLTGNLIDASASYAIADKHIIKAAIHSSSRMPDFNFLLYQSDYRNYNWQNTGIFEKERINSLELSVQSSVWGNASIKYTSLDNYTYFTTDPTKATQEQLDEGLENAYLSPFQEANAVNYLKVKYNKEFRFGDFALNNTIMYQNVTQDTQVFNVPDFVTRNTLYYSKEIFDKAMYVQTGVTFKYFTSYNADSYSPLLGSFYVQNQEEIGDFPLIDFFINAKIRQTRIYLKAEHLNSLFVKEPTYYAAPNYPYRDFVIRFGLVWNFFS